jgi:hypothetical protein
MNDKEIILRLLKNRRQSKYVSEEKLKAEISNPDQFNSLVNELIHESKIEMIM